MKKPRSVPMDATEEQLAEWLAEVAADADEFDVTEGQLAEWIAGNVNAADEFDTDGIE